MHALQQACIHAWVDLHASEYNCQSFFETIALLGPCMSKSLAPLVLPTSCAPVAVFVQVCAHSHANTCSHM
jgi:hypothetical protein